MPTVHDKLNGDPWSRYVPSGDALWNVRRVVHLHRRAAFAAAWDQVQRDRSDGPDKSVDRLLSDTPQENTEYGDFETMSRTIGDAAVASSNANRLKAWWIYRMLFSPEPLTERLALMWHNHFATSNLKVDDVALMWQQNELFRQYGRGKFGGLLRRVVKDPATLVWLDAQANRKEHPNENLARELMELFTLGEGNFTETDVHEAARALTGWTVVRGRFREVEQYHDSGAKTILGKTGKFNGADLLTILLEHPAAARRLAWRICDTFLGEGVVDEPAIDGLAEGLRNNDLDIGWAIETVLRSRLFFCEQNIGSRVLGPAAFVIGAVRALEMFDPPPSTLLLAEQIGRLGQDLFYPPNVFGWHGGRTWINTRSLIGRGNFATLLVEGRLCNPPRPLGAHDHACRYDCGDNRQEMLSFFTQLLTVGGEADAEFVNRMIGVCKRAETEDEAARLMVAAVLALPEAQLG